jgi:OOP family OmpA-OmpF porin
MNFRAALLAATVLAVPFLAGGVKAQPVDGLYVGAGAGGNYLQQERVLASPGLGTGAGRLRTQIGGVGVASVGYGFGNGLRLEVEGNIRHNRVEKLDGFPRNPGFASGDQYSYGGMANALFDMDIGYNWIYPYIGLGAGIEDSHLDGFRYTGTTTALRERVAGYSVNFAYQGIFGLSFPLASVPGLSLTTEYRFLGVLDAPSFRGTNNLVSANGRTSGRAGNFNLNSDYNHSFIVGVRYAFDTAPPPVPEAPVAAPASVPARTYLVFFDWDRADLTERARQIIGEAASASTRVQTTRIDVQGNADRSGTPKYNQGLSLRRAQVVSAELVRRGVPKQEIAIQAFGDTRPLVATAAGVREPQNRRVEIILH